MTSTADGNCLFHSASTALLGNEDISSDLRLFAAIHAVLHFEHYVTKVNMHDPLHIKVHYINACFHSILL